MTRIERVLVKLSEIPSELIPFRLLTYSHGAYMPFHIEDDVEYDDLDKWLIENYPGIQYENEFLIQIDG